MLFQSTNMPAVTPSGGYLAESLAVILAPVVIKVTCLVIGYLVIRTGARLLEQGIKGEFKFKGSLAGARADLVSASPGLLFLLLGIALLGYAIAVNKPIHTEYQVTSQPPQQEQGPSVPLPPAPGPADSR